MKIGEVATAAGVSVQAVRFYERRGLIMPPKRLPSGYRDYAPETVATIGSIKDLQAVGFTLREAAEFVKLLGGKARHPAKNRAIAEGKLRSLDAQVTRLKKMRAELETRLVSCACCNDVRTLSTK